jgi:hypothetical protein
MNSYNYSIIKHLDIYVKDRFIIALDYNLNRGGFFIKPSIKAALLSGLVCPGVGQLYLKRRTLGFAIIAIVVICLIVIFYLALTTARIIVTQEFSQPNMDLQRTLDKMPQVLEHASEMTKNDNPYYYTCFFLIVILWVYSIFDALFITEKK